ARVVDGAQGGEDGGRLLAREEARAPLEDARDAGRAEDVADEVDGVVATDEDGDPPERAGRLVEALEDEVRDGARLLHPPPLALVVGDGLGGRREVEDAFRSAFTRLVWLERGIGRFPGRGRLGKDAGEDEVDEL